MMIKIIRYYDHDLCPRYSGIAVFDEQNNYSVFSGKFDASVLEKLKKENPEALLQNFPLRDLSF